MLSILIKFQEPIRFIIVGGIATIVHYGIYLLLNPFTITWLAYSIGYILSFFLNFYLSSKFTFKSKANIKKGIGFATSHLINYGLHILLLTLFLKIGIQERYAPIPVFMIAIPINFLLVRFVFISKKFNHD